MKSLRNRVLLMALSAGIVLGAVMGCAELKSLGAGALQGASDAGGQAIHERVANDPRIPVDLKPAAEAIIDGVVKSIPKPVPAEPNVPLFMLGQALVYGVLTSFKEVARTKGWFGKNPLDASGV